MALNAQGEVVPALADRWNVIEDGSIFVFRLRDGTWPNGEDLTATSVRDALQRAIRSLRGTSLGLDLVPIDEVRAMAGRVVEVRLASPMPDLLQVLAQPELGLVHGQGETGPMVLERDGERLELARGQALDATRRTLQIGQAAEGFRGFEERDDFFRIVGFHVFSFNKIKKGLAAQYIQ